jgi:cytochrome c oxidase accessory protein FixG
VSYDAVRGDPRGTRARGADPKASGLGDCIDCGLCVHVCPVGIDIRDGLQYECIACSACVDACDSVMDKMKYPRGLIRYATQNSLDQRSTRAQMLRRMFRPRVLIYGAVLIAIASAFVVSLSLREPFKVDVVRDRMTLARMVDQGAIENLYRLQLMNATERSQRYRIEVAGLIDAQIVNGNGNADDVEVLPAQARWVTLAVRVPAQTAQSLGAGAHPMRFEVTALGNASAKVTERSTFVVLR